MTGEFDLQIGKIYTNTLDNMYDLSVIIPARGEELLDRTIQDLLENIEGKTEIIAVLDGYRPDPPLTQIDPRVTIIYNPESIGQRAASNQAARLSKAKYLMKVDAHCGFDKGFDVKMLADMKDDWTMVPTMRNLHAFNWVCADDHARYQGPSGPCQFPKNPKGDGPKCEKPTTKDLVWIHKTNPSSVSYRFDKTMHFQYFGAYKHTDEYKAGVDGDLELNESMSIQGSCFMITKDKWFELDICSEDFHSWGQQGVEVACKTWMSGGRVVVSRKTWYSHMFRTQGGDFSFPYHNPQSKVNENREKSRQLFQKDNWPLATRKFQWILDKFNPPDWTITKGMLYYTDNQLEEEIAGKVKNQLKKIATEKKMLITTSSLKKIDGFGDRAVRFPSMKRGYLTMFKQILGGLEKSTDDIIFFTEHDVVYHPSHFDFDPPEKDVFYYNENIWFMRFSDGHALQHRAQTLSGLCGYRDALLTHFRERYEMALAERERLEKEAKGDEEKEKNLERDFNRYIRNMGFEPMTHGRVKWKTTYKSEGWRSEHPIIDIRHGENPTGQRWRKDQFRNKKFTEGWKETKDIPGWGHFKDFWEKLK